MCDLRRWITEIINKQWALSCWNASLSAFRRSHAFTFTRFSLALIYSLLSPPHPFLSALMTMQHTFKQENLCGTLSTGTIKWGTFPQAVDFSAILKDCCISRPLPVLIRVVTSNRLLFLFACLFVFNKPVSSLVTGSPFLEKALGVRATALTLSLDWFFFFSYRELFVFVMMWYCRKCNLKLEILPRWEFLLKNKGPDQIKVQLYIWNDEASWRTDCGEHRKPEVGWHICLITVFRLRWRHWRAR